MIKLKFATIFFLFIFLFQSNVFAKQNKYSQCLKSADIGDFIINEKYSGIDYENIEVQKAEPICLDALNNFPNDVKILRSLGRIYFKNKSFKESLEFYFKASKLGDAFSFYRLSEAYRFGLGVEIDYKKAFQYILKSKQKGHSYALEEIGEYYKFGIGTKVNPIKALQSYKKCSELNIEKCLVEMYVTYSEGLFNEKPNEELKLSYINKLLEINSNEGYIAMGEHLIKNAKDEIDVRNGLLNYDKAKEEAYPFLLEIYFFPDKYPIFFKMYSNVQENKTKGLKLLKEIFTNDKHENYDLNLTYLKNIVNSPEYTKALSHQDLKQMIKKLDIISRNFKPTSSQIQGEVIQNEAATILGDYYNNGFFTKVDLTKSYNYYSLAADRNDFNAAVNAAWTAYTNKDYKSAIKYNNFVIEKSNDPEMQLYAHNNNAVIDDEIKGTGTKFQIESYLKAVKIIEKYDYFVSWPYENLANIYYYPIKNSKNENSDIQDIEKASFYNSKYLKMMEDNGYADIKDTDLLYFLLSKFKKTPKNLKESVQYLEYAAVNGYTYAYFELAWLYSGFRQKDYKNEIYKWYYICSIVAHTETQETCKANIKDWENRISYFERKELEQTAADYVLYTGDRLAELEKELGFDKPDINYAKNLNFGNYYALLIGINKYEYLQDLRTPINDVNRLEHVLKEKYKFNTNKIINPSRRELLKEINKYTKSLSKNDNLIIYFAGHGEQKADEGFWLTGEAREDDDIDWISVSRIQRKLREIKANNILVVADSCFSGLLTRGLNIKRNNFKQSSINFLHKAKSRIALTSGNNEPVLDGGGGENSIFAASLASALEIQTKPFTASELYLQIQKKVIEETLAFGMKQNPLLYNIPRSGHENMDFVFNPK